MVGAGRSRDPPAGGEARGAGDRKYDIRGTPGRAGGGRGERRKREGGGKGSNQPLNHHHTGGTEGTQALPGSRCNITATLYLKHVGALQC